MEIVEEIVEEEEPQLVNTVAIVEEIVEEEETQLVNTMETVLEIVEDEETRLVNTIKSTLETLPPLPTKCCIYRVPYLLRRLNEEAYTPMLVSIGPFHHGKESLQEMEVHKQRYLNDFLKRKPHLNLEYYVRSLKEFEGRARNCYDENIHYSSNDFVQMMLLDSCFIVEFCLKYYHPILRNKDDPIFKRDVMRNGIMRDMMLLENQLPFFILLHLFNLNVGFILDKGDSLFVKMALNIMDFIRGGSEQWIESDETTNQAKHMVDICLKFFTPTGIELPPKTEGGDFSIPNATGLHESGVKFTIPASNSVKCFLDVKFTNGNLEIPNLNIVDETETFLRNLIAFEQCDKGNTHFFSRYVYVMDYLIDTPNDVELLRKAGIINNNLGDNEKVSLLFNKLGIAVSTGEGFYLEQLFEDVNAYCRKPWHAWRAKLKRDYFNTPWTIISVVAAVILLVLAFIQSVCSILQLKG